MLWGRRTTLQPTRFVEHPTLAQPRREEVQVPGVRDVVAAEGLEIADAKIEERLIARRFFIDISKRAPLRSRARLSLLVALYRFLGARLILDFFQNTKGTTPRSRCQEPGSP